MRSCLPRRTGQSAAQNPRAHCPSWVLIASGPRRTTSFGLAERFMVVARQRSTGRCGEFGVAAFDEIAGLRNDALQDFENGRFSPALRGSRSCHIRDRVPLRAREHESGYDQA